MNFDITEEQQLVKDSVTRFVQENYELEARLAISGANPGYSEDHWKTFADLGWLGLPFSEEDGGFGGTAIDTMLIFEEFGKGLVVEPYLASVVLGGGVLRHGAESAQKSEIITALAAGELKLALAYAEEQSRFDLHDITTSARAEGDKYIINGAKSMVLNAETADHIIVSARTSGGQVDKSGISLFLIPRETAGLKVDGFPTVDGLRAAEISLGNVSVGVENRIGAEGSGYETLNAAINDGILAIAAEALGGMEVLYKDTVAYTQEREQFDHPMSDFQVVQHRLVEMFMEYEQCKSLLYRATLEQAQNAPTAQRTIHALKHMVGKAGCFIGENAVQLHGGMGMTEELRVAHYFKRLLVIDSQFGNADHHLELFAA